MDCRLLLKQFFFLRPYSFTGVLSIALLASLFAQPFSSYSIFVDFAAALLLWITAIFIGEYFHLKSDKRRLPFALLVFSVAAFFALAVFLEPKALILFVLMLALCLIYANKSRIAFVSPFSFLVRGFLEVIIFLTVLLFHLHSFNALAAFWQPVTTIYLITVSRNLVGDVRDVKYDKHSFPKQFGVKPSRAVAFALLAATLAIVPSPSILLPAIPVLLLLLCGAPSYLTHASFVASTFAIYLNYCAFLAGYDLLLTNLFYAGAALLITYFFTPRNANADFKRLLK